MKINVDKHFLDIASVLKFSFTPNKLTNVLEVGYDDEIFWDG